MITYKLNDTSYGNNFNSFRTDLEKLLLNKNIVMSIPTLPGLIFPSKVDYFKDKYDITIERIIEQDPPKPEPTPEELLEQAKTKKIKELTNDKYQEIKRGMLYKTIDGVDYIADTDNDAKTAINGQILAFNEGLMETVDWKFQDYKWLTFNESEFKEFAGTVLAWIEAKFVKERELINQVNACTTVEEVEAINWNTNEEEE